MLDLLLLAQDAPAPPPDPTGGWLGLILGPLGVLAVLLFYAYKTETKRLPELKEIIKQRDQTLIDNLKACEADKQKLRDENEADEMRYEKELRVMRGKHSKERGLRTWWQSKAEDLAKRHGEEPPVVPTDIDTTFYGGSD